MFSSRGRPNEVIGKVPAPMENSGAARGVGERGPPPPVGGVTDGGLESGTSET